MKISTATIPAILMLGVLATPGPADAACANFGADPLTRLCADAEAFVLPPRESARYVAAGGQFVTCSIGTLDTSLISDDTISGVGGACFGGHGGERLLLTVRDVGFGSQVPALVSFQPGGEPYDPREDPGATPFCGSYAGTIGGAPPSSNQDDYVNVVVAVFDLDDRGICGGGPAGATAGVITTTRT